MTSDFYLSIKQRHFTLKGFIACRLRSVVFLQGLIHRLGFGLVFWKLIQPHLFLMGLYLQFGKVKQKVHLLLWAIFQKWISTNKVQSERQRFFKHKSVHQGCCFVCLVWVLNHRTATMWHGEVIVQEIFVDNLNWSGTDFRNLFISLRA